MRVLNAGLVVVVGRGGGSGGLLRFNGVESPSSKVGVKWRQSLAHSV